MEASTTTNTLNFEVKCSDTVVEKDYKGDFAEFEKQKHILNTKFQETEEVIVALYFGERLELRDGAVNIHKIKKTVRNILLPLHLMVMRHFEDLFFGNGMQVKQTQ